MTVMLGFARKNNAAVAKFRIRFVFIPIHMIYASVLILGIVNEDLGMCHEKTYPRIFGFQYALFFTTYLLCLILYYTDYFLEWDESIKDIDLENLG